MSHNINVVNGRASIFYTGEQPWHKLGTKLDNPATSREAIMAAGLDWRVEKEPIYLKDGKLVSGSVGSVRQDTRETLGVVSNSYRIIQNIEAFDFFDSVVGTKEAMYETAGALGTGERIWLMAKLPENLVVAPDDVVEQRLVLTNSHDGGSSLKVYFTPVRVVCQNTLTASMKNHSREVSVSHRGDVMGKVKEARKILGLSLDFFSEFKESAEAMVQEKMNSLSVETYFDKVLSLDQNRENRGGEASARILNVKDTLMHLFEQGRGNDAQPVRHSLWAAYNAVTEYADHYKRVRNGSVEANRKLDDIWFGGGAVLKNKAYNLALAAL